MTAFTSDIETDRPTDASRAWNRIAGFAGIAFVVLFIGLGASIAANAPDFTDGADEIRSWFGDNQGPIALFTWITPLVFGVLQLLFATGLLRRLAVDDTSRGILPRFALSGVVANFAAGVVGVGIWGVMTLDPVLENATDGLLLTLSALDTVVFFVVMPWTSAVFLGVTSVLILRTRAMPAWLAGVGFLGAIIPVIGGAWLFSGDPNSAVRNVGFIGEVLGMLWIVIASVFLIRDTAD